MLLIYREGYAMRVPKQKIICVDYFDTTVYRDLTEFEIKRLWGLELSRELNYTISSEILTKYRLMVERNIADTGYASIYKYGFFAELLYDRLINHFFQIPLEKNTFIMLSLKIEQQLEEEHQVVNHDIADMLIKAKTEGHYIVLVSDFYLGCKSFESFLNKLNLRECFDRIYISCDYTKSKANSQLYQLVTADLKKQFGNDGYSDSVMIGDKYFSDYKNSRINGIGHSIHYKPPRGFNRKPLNKSFYQLFDQYSTLSNYAFSLYLFCDRLYEYCIKHEIDTLYFLSREGKILKQLFDIYKSNKETIHTEYLYVSRNSTFLPSLKCLKKEDFSRLLNQYNNKISIFTFLKLLHFSDEEMADMEIENIETVRDNITEENDFISLLASDFFKSTYEAKRNEARNNFLGYLKGKGINRGGRYCIVDVGWKGTMQDNIWNLFDGEIDITGMYLGYSRQGEEHVGSHKLGLLFDYINYNGCSEISSDIFAFNSFLIEMVLVADHGRTEGYTANFQPVLKEDDDLIMFKEYSSKIQKDIEKKFVDICAIKKAYVLDKCEISVFEELHGKMFKKLSIEDIKLIENMILLHKDGFGNKKSGAASGSKLIRLFKIKTRPYIKMKGFYNSKNGIAKW